jgi:phage-related protein
MRSVGGAVREIRVHCDGEYRVLYVATLAENVYVLHVFQKKTRRPSRRDVDLARRRLSAVRGH